MYHLFAVLLLAASTLCAGELSNRRAPGFSLPDMKGQQHDPQDYRGKVLLIDIMRTDCPGCAGFAKTLVRLKAKYGDKLGIISVVNPPDTQQTVGQFIAGHKLTTPVVFDCGQVAYSYMKSPSFDTPHVFLVDGTGMIREDFGHSVLNHSLFEGDGLATYIDRLMGGGAAAAKPAAKQAPAKKK
jgi:peroxiredoxin